MFAGAFGNRAVWVSGHTGFKGAWLAQWLLELGANVHGFALEPAGSPALFSQLGLAERLHHQVADLRDGVAVRNSISAAQPDFVFHLAAQPLVRRGYEVPVETYATNVLGTIHVLEALRELSKPCAAVLITTDKCYLNREWLHGYREEDPLGGDDPYSSSKAAAELAIHAWRCSFFAEHPVWVASARAGNVIGGGDWAPDRIVPDCIRALQHSQPIPVRNPSATRPWQHVLEPLSGYLWLGALLAERSLAKGRRQALASAFNFGPTPESNRTVGELVTEVLNHWPGSWENRSNPEAVHEAHRLQLSFDKAHALLGWRPVWDFETAVAATVSWYREADRFKASASAPKEICLFTSRQIEQYQDRAVRARLPWATA